MNTEGMAEDQRVELAPLLDLPETDGVAPAAGQARFARA
jgi:hypothetical protein